MGVAALLDVWGGEDGRAPSGGLRSCACSRTGWGRHHHQQQMVIYVFYWCGQQHMAGYVFDGCSLQSGIEFGQHAMKNVYVVVYVKYR